MRRPFGYLQFRKFAGGLCLCGTILCGCASEDSLEYSGHNESAEPPRASQDINSEDRGLQLQLRRYVADFRSQLAGLSTGTDLKFDVATYDQIVEISFVFPASDREKNPGMSLFMSSILVSYSCSNYKTRHWLERGASFRYRFLDSNRNLILQSDANQETCAAM